ncbi:MAG: phage tail tape measure protein [Firmicutes bacterium]|nr:phage tail tape measure protein [Bacillota bacterium]
MADMIEVARATVTIIPNMKGSQSAITKEITGASDEAGAEGGKSMGKSMLGQLALVMTSAAVGKILKSAVMDAADLEQSLGGIETLFKDSADTVKQNAQNAWQTAGISANQYMEQATSFSATLIKSLGGDTAAAAAYADKAIIAMSDNANKMGTDIASIQSAYQGFAKQNYTMLDNLKLGYGGTASEMARLINDSGVLGDSITVTADTVKDVPFDTVIDAIQTIQTDLGITGATAVEGTTTLSGSINALKASTSNLTAELGMALLPVITPLINKVTEAVQWFTSLDDETKQTIVIVMGVVAAIGPLIAIITSLKSTVSTVTSVISFFTTGTLGPAIIIIGAVVAAGVALYQNWDKICEWAIRMKNTIVETFNTIKTSITEKINAAKDAVKNAIDKIKGFFNFRFSWPSLPMPHFSVSPYGWSIGDLLKGSIPRLSVSFYAKAAEEGAMFASPAIIGVGDAAQPEMLIGRDTLYDNIKRAVNESAGMGAPVINVYPSQGMNEESLARRIGDILQDLVDEREAVYG